MSDVADRFDNLRVPVTANLRKNGDTPYYGANGIQDYVDGYTHDGEYILVAEDGANNLKNYPINYVSGRIWVNNHAHVLQAIPNLANTRFLGYEIGRSNIISLLVGGGRAKLNADALMNMSLNLPKMHEQELITEIVKTISHTITLHEEKKHQLECLKSALLQKMFADKSGYPAVRFKGFSEAWESRKLFDVIVKIIDFRGRTPKKMGLNWSERGHLALSALNVKDGYIDFSTDAHYANEILYKKWMSGNELLKGQVLFTTEAPMGNVAQVPDDGGYVLSQRTISFVSNNSKITDNFLAVVLRSSKVQRALSTLASGGTAKGVSQSTLSQLIMVIPISLDEQQKIERIIGIVEELTRLYQNKLEILTELKKSLLQNMFI